MGNKTKIPAVYKEDLQIFLQSINELECIKKRDRICMVCLKTISIENIQLIIPRQNQTFDFVCDNIVCVEEYNHKKGV
ncbi:MAG: hypothetical protein LBH44_14465 [Treponema sp.]|nr:hypothetical protein [Treponema sp.]